MKRKDPPDYPGDEAILKAFGEGLRAIRLARGLSEEEVEALAHEATRTHKTPQLPRALGLVVRQLREQSKLSRLDLSHASGLTVRFLTALERGKVANASLTQIVRICTGLKHPIPDFVEQVETLEKKLRSEAKGHR